MVVCLGSLWMALGPGQIVPVERNILYAHVPSSICALLCFVVVFIASIAYLASARRLWDYISAAAAEAGTVFAFGLNATGMVFSRAEWNIWWTPSPRLVSSAILLFLYLVYLILRSSITQSFHRRAKVCAIFGIIAFLDVPMVIISARFLPDIHRASFSFESSWQSAALMLNMLAMVLLAVILIWLRIDQLRNRSYLEERIIS
jgi:heme exporter protein C